MKKFVLGFAPIVMFVLVGVFSIHPHPSAPGTEGGDPGAGAALVPALEVTPAEAQEQLACKPNGIQYQCSSGSECCSGCCGSCGGAIVSCVAASCCK